MTNEKIELVFTLSPREREKDYPKPASPPNDFESLELLDAQTLKELGCRPWGREKDARGNEIEGAKLLWLYPGEWYSAIPNGLSVVDIFYKDDVFELGVADNDIRFGCLSFGFYGPDLESRTK